MSNTTRRDVLKSIGTVGVIGGSAAIAGCATVNVKVEARDAVSCRGTVHPDRRQRTDISRASHLLHRPKLRSACTRDGL